MWGCGDFVILKVKVKSHLNMMMLQAFIRKVNSVCCWSLVNSTNGINHMEENDQSKIRRLHL